MKFSDPSIRVSYAKAVFGKEEIAALNKLFETPMIVAGPYVKKFETKIARIFAKKYGVMTNSGSSANLIALELLQLPDWSEVITPVLTFGTTVSPLLQKRLVPIFVDVAPGTYQINVDQVERVITKKTKALMIPSLIGNIPDYPRLQKIAKANDLYLIEDSCDTLGAKIAEKSTGVYSDISTTSFYGSHIITAAGSGGLISFNRQEWYERAKTLVGWGRSSAHNETERPTERFDIKLFGVPYDKKFIFEEVGYNFLSTDVSAVFGLAQLGKLKEFSQARKKNFQQLLNFFKGYEEFFTLPEQNPKADTAWLAFPITVSERAPFKRIDIVMYLEKHNIQTRPLFTGNALRQPAFKGLAKDQKMGKFPVADAVMQNAFLVGCHHGLSKLELNYLQEVFDRFLAKWKK